MANTTASIAGSRKIVSRSSIQRRPCSRQKSATVAGVAGVCSREANRFTVPHGVNEIAAPPAETHDGCPNCRAGHAAPNCFEIPLSSVKRDSPIGWPTAAGRYPSAVRSLTSLIDGESPASHRSYQPRATG